MTDFAAQQLLDYAQAGYNGEPNTALWSSACWLAYRAGECLSIIRKSNRETIKNAYTIEHKTVDPRSVLNGYLRPLHFISDALGKRANEIINAGEVEGCPNCGYLDCNGWRCLYSIFHPEKRGKMLKKKSPNPLPLPSFERIY